MQVPMAPALPPPTHSSCGLQGSLLFPLEGLDGTSSGPHRDAHNHTCSQALTLGHLLSLSLSNRWPRQLAADIRRLKRDMMVDSDSDQVDVVLLAAMLQDLGYHVLVRCALGGIKSTGANAGPGSCFRNLRHEFLYVRCDSGEYENVEFLIDPNFKEQFAIPQPTARYRMLLETVPDEFVGTSMRLQPVVELLCTEMAASFEARGLAVPPWRRTSAMLSKWLPAKSKDYAIDLNATGGCSPPGYSPRARLDQLDQGAAGAGFVPFAPGSPERRMRKEAAQMLEALAQHTQQHASPKHSPRVSAGLSLQEVDPVQPLQLQLPLITTTSANNTPVFMLSSPDPAFSAPLHGAKSAPLLLRAPSAGRGGSERVSLLSDALKANSTSNLADHQHVVDVKGVTKASRAMRVAAAAPPPLVRTTQPAVAGQPAIHKVKLLAQPPTNNNNN